MKKSLEYYRNVFLGVHFHLNEQKHLDNYRFVFPLVFHSNFLYFQRNLLIN